MGLNPEQAQRVRNIGDSRQERIVKKIANDHGVFALPDGRDLVKFGRSTVIGTSYSTVWAHGDIWHEFVGNVVNSISSDNASDTGIDIAIHGVVVDVLTGKVTNFNDEIVTLNGQTRVVLTREYHSISRSFVENGTFVSPAVSIQGTVHIYQFEDGDSVTNGVPDTHDKIANSLSPEAQQTQTAAFHIPDDTFFVVDDYSAQIYKKNSGYIDAVLMVREIHGVWRLRNELSVPAFQGHAIHEFNRPFIIPPNSKVRIDALADTSNTEVSADISGELYRVLDVAP